jgi:hypothetical protein
LKTKKKPAKKSHKPWVYVHIPHIDAWVIALLGWEPEKASKFILSRYNHAVEMDSEGSCTILHNKKNSKKIVFIHSISWRKDSQHYALLVHEVLHACLLLNAEIGQGICTKDHEHLTYLTQYIFQTILEKLNHEKNSRRSS